MNILNKFIKPSLSIILASLVLFQSCEETDITNSHKLEAKGFVNFDLNSKRVSLINDTKSNENQHSINHVLTFDSQIHSFNSQEEYESFLLENLNELNGKYEVFIDNEIIYSVQIINGEKFDEIIYESSSNRSLSCTFAEVRACAVERIHNQNVFDMTLCIIEGFGCVVNHYMSCATDLCINQEE